MTMPTDPRLRPLVDALADLEARAEASSEISALARDLGTAYMAEGGHLAYTEAATLLREALEEVALGD